MSNLQGYKSFIANIVAALVSLLVLFNVDVSAADQDMIAQYLTTVAASLVGFQTAVAVIMRLVTKTPPGKQVKEVRESVLVAGLTDTDDVLGDVDEK